jgi:hypothetical protein
MSLFTTRLWLKALRWILHGCERIELFEGGLKEVRNFRGVRHTSNQVAGGSFMTSEGGSSRRDEAMPMGVKWDLGVGGQYNDVLWRCDALRAGKLYQRSLFGTQAEAEEFAAKMREVEPDQMFNVEGIKAATVWN